MLWRQTRYLRSTVAWWTNQGWLAADPTVTPDRRREHPDRTRAPGQTTSSPPQFTIVAGTLAVANIRSVWMLMSSW